MSTINGHYHALQKHDRKRWREMRGLLAAKDCATSDCLTYFKRSILEKEVKKKMEIDMAVLPHFIVKQFVEYFGFTWDNINNNVIPPLE